MKEKGCLLRVGSRSVKDWHPIGTVWLPIGLALADLDMKLALGWLLIGIKLVQDWHQIDSRIGYRLAKDWLQIG